MLRVVGLGGYRLFPRSLSERGRNGETAREYHREQVRHPAMFHLNAHSRPLFHGHVPDSVSACVPDSAPVSVTVSAPVAEPGASLTRLTLTVQLWL